MRIIKFRIWDGEDMLPMGDSIEFRNALFHKIRVTHKYVDLREPDCKDFHLMQFTGLTDKNGKEIYEGDIIKKCGYNKKERQWIKYYRVIYEYDAFCLEKDGETYAFGFSKDGKLIKEEIIGNIHEHNFLLDEN